VTQIAEIEAEITTYWERADRAEQWLHRVYTEIEGRFLRQNDGRRRVNGAAERTEGNTAR
jgi:hypothetical protein